MNLLYDSRKYIDNNILLRRHVFRDGFVVIENDDFNNYLFIIIYYDGLIIDDTFIKGVDCDN
jgi:hypothetical protein